MQKQYYLIVKKLIIRRVKNNVTIKIAKNHHIIYFLIDFLMGAIISSLQQQKLRL